MQQTQDDRSTRARRWGASTLAVLLGAGALGWTAPVASAATNPAVDTTPPVVVSVTATPSIDVSDAPATIVVEVAATDDLSGVESVSAQLQSPAIAGRDPQTVDGILVEPTTGSRTDGSWRLEMFVPRNVQAGPWCLSDLRIVDITGNETPITAEDRAAFGACTEVTSRPDFNGPRLVSVTAPPATTTFDASAGPATIPFDVHLTDDVSGTEQVFALLTPPRDTIGHGQRRDVPAQVLAPSTGTRTDGTWHLDFEVPRYARPGQWCLTYLYASDFAGNPLDAQIGPGTDTVACAEVTSSPVDTTPPVVVSVTATPSIDVSDAPATIVVDVAATDDLSGVESVSAQLQSPAIAGRDPQTVDGILVEPTTGSRTDGSWRLEMFVPRNVQAGPWCLSDLRIVDITGNETPITAEDRAAFGACTEVTSRPDFNGPRLVSVTAPPATTTFDASAGPATIPFDVHLTDDVSGTEQVFALLTPPRDTIGHGQRRDVPAQVLAPSTGTRTDGTWHLDFEVPRYARPGQWCLTYLYASDFAGNPLDAQIGPGTDTVACAKVGTLPRAVDQAVTTPQGQPVRVTVAGSDPQGGPVTFAVAGRPAHGRVSSTGPDFTYQPGPGYFGPDAFTFTVTDERGGVATGTVSITVTKVNRAPSAGDDERTLGEDTPLSEAAPGLLANDTDPDGDALTAWLVAGPAHGTVDLRADGSFTYRPDPDRTGDDAFTYQASDGAATSPVATVRLHVLPAPLIATRLAVAPAVAQILPGLRLGLAGQARLTSVTGAPLPGRLVTFAFGPVTCQAVTDATGTARCALTVGSLVSLLLSGDYRATFAGDADHAASSGQGPLLQVGSRSS